MERFVNPKRVVKFCKGNGSKSRPILYNSPQKFTVPAFFDRNKRPSIFSQIFSRSDYSKWHDMEWQ